MFGPPQRVRERRAARDAALIIILLELLDLVDLLHYSTMGSFWPINMLKRRMRDSTLKTDHSPMLIDRLVRKTRM